ncbi:MAG TPA: hypothetical protein VHE60_00020 [Pyrinomonadaceae bacterium]|nr:hypothetical protein [Pyrinomonadaceae bacterium]
MAKDDRDILGILKDELEFIEQGGYGRSVRTPWKPTSALQDSLTCINFGDPSRAHPCSDCRLMEFVAPEHRAENIPCHFIPLTESGETVEDLELKGNQSRLEESLKQWLRRKISELEAERAAKNTT